MPLQLNSMRFFIFFAGVFALYWALPPKCRKPVLLFASLLFYCSFGTTYLGVLLLCILLTYFGGLRLGAHPAKGRLAVWVVAGLAPLAFFKYFNFSATLIASFLSAVTLPVSPLLLKLAQPVGISYFTFQMIGYLVDVYRGKQQPERDFCTAALFLSFFPQILAGPLTRPRVLAQEFRRPAMFCAERAFSAAQLMILGLFKKMVVADTLAYYTGQVFSQQAALGRLTGGSFLIITVFYTFQLYADFSGYTDLARGAAGLLGIELCENFRTPYLSRSIKEFWSRWHIGLSSWLQEYVYIPLGGSRVSKPRHYFNLMVTFFISGLWHGASVQMVLWGLLHGAYLVVGDITRGMRTQLAKQLHWQGSRGARVVSTGVTFCLVAFAWIFFAAVTPEQAFYIAGHLFDGFTPTVQYLKESVVLLGIGAKAAVRLTLSIAALIVLDLVTYRTIWPELLAKLPRWAVIICCYGLLLAVILFGNVGASDFIYFKF